MNLKYKKLLILDMNSTFMFGEDRFSEDENYSKHYKSIGGKLDENQINQVIEEVYNYLDIRYPQESYRENFPSLKEAVHNLAPSVSDDEVEKIIDTFAFHERGYISEEYVACLKNLSQHFTLAAVIDIWAPSDRWVELFKELEIYDLFSAISFSSDINIVKPSKIPYQNVLNQLGFKADEALAIGDSVRRDLGSAISAGIDCVIVGNNSDKAIACYSNLLEFEKELFT